MDSNYLDSQFSRESEIEKYFIPILASNFRRDEKLLEKFKDFKELRPIPHNISWEMMKDQYGWGYRKGSIISSLITWIYLRPDVKLALDNENNENIKNSTMTVKFILNEHYFLVEQRAIEYLKNHCTDFISDGGDTSDKEDDNENSSRASDTSELSYQALKRRRLSKAAAPFGIDDAAIEN
jgi:hypothetical protein